MNDREKWLPARHDDDDDDKDTVLMEFFYPLCMGFSQFILSPSDRSCEKKWEPFRSMEVGHVFVIDLKRK